MKILPIMLSFKAFISFDVAAFHEEIKAYIRECQDYY